MAGQALSGGPPLLWLKAGGGTAAGCHPGPLVRAVWESRQGCQADLTRSLSRMSSPTPGGAGSTLPPLRPEEAGDVFTEHG